jgi:hypothetical protein
MKIAVILASNQLNGKCGEIETTLKSSKLNHEFDFIRLTEMEIAPTKSVINENDNFDNILNRLIEADAVFIVVPVYCPYPAKFCALMERLLDVSYQNPNKPLKGKPVAIFYYCSIKICDETRIKILFQKYLMDDYSFDIPNYSGFINNESNPNEKYNNDVLKYILDVAQKL